MKNSAVANTLAIFKREFLSYFNSPVLYVIVVIYLLVAMSFTFFFGGFLQNNSASLEAFFGYHPWIFIVFAPAVGMRMWSEEHRLGTFELLMTMPLSPWHAIIGKFLASALVWAIGLALTFSIVITVSWLGNPDPGPIISGYVACYFYAIGCLAVTSAVSAFTRSQVICFIVSVTLCLGLTLIGFPGLVDTVVLMLPSSFEILIRFISYFSFLDHFTELTKGNLIFRDILYFISAIVVSMIITEWGLRSKRA